MSEFIKNGHDGHDGQDGHKSGYHKSDEKREQNGSEVDNLDGRKREENGSPMGEQSFADSNGAEEEFHDDDWTPAPTNQYVGPGHPPAEHQFKKGNPGGPGRPRGPKSMRRLVRDMIFDEKNDAYYARAIRNALILEAANGNTHAIRLVCENTNFRRGIRVGARPRRSKSN